MRGACLQGWAIWTDVATLAARSLPPQAPPPKWPWANHPHQPDASARLLADASGWCGGITPEMTVDELAAHQPDASARLLADASGWGGGINPSQLVLRA